MNSDLQNRHLFDPNFLKNLKFNFEISIGFSPRFSCATSPLVTLVIESYSPVFAVPVLAISPLGTGTGRLSGS